MWSAATPKFSKKPSFCLIRKSFQRSLTGALNSGSGKISDRYDAIVIGAGHNGLVSAAYLGKAGLNVCVLEKRNIVGGAAVTEEIIPGFKFSRASYVLSLLQPEIISDLQLKNHGLKVHLRNPHSYTPIRESHRNDEGRSSLTLFSQMEKTIAEITKFSSHDAKKYPLYEKQLSHFVAAIEPLLKNPPPDHESNKPLIPRLRSLIPLYQTGKILGSDLTSFYELATSSVSKILDQWFESDILKATLAMDGVIGSMCGPDTPGTGYILLHHCMGETDGLKGAWGYPEGGMGAVTQAIANAAISHGVNIATDTIVKEILVGDNGQVEGVLLNNGTSIKSKCVLSNATPKITFLNLLAKGVLSDDHLCEIKRIDYSSSVTKINLALKTLPNFSANPNLCSNVPMPHHQTTIHLNCEKMSVINDAFIDALQGNVSKRPIIEMVIPSSLDSTLAPPGCHVCLLFTQYTPYQLKDKEWNTITKNEYLNIVLDSIEEYAPGFRESVIGGEVLCPVDLEEIFSLTNGNIYHGAMSLDQIFIARPFLSVTSPKTPVTGLYLCGSGAHPGGGVMGVPGRLAALTALKYFNKI